MPFFYAMDPLYLLCFGAALVLSLLAQGWVKSSFARYSQVPNLRRLSGAEAAHAMLVSANITGVRINRYSGGWLSDHYNPADQTINLSPGIYDGRSVAAVGIACHEAGHAIQHAQGYGLLTLRNWVVPTANIGSALGVPLIIIGMLMGSLGLAKIGLGLFSLVFVFQLITLPVELDASSRSKAALINGGIVAHGVETEGVSRVLTAAAMTYVAAAVGTLLTILYYAYRLGLLGGRSRND
ncbi:MAG: zinc metallopeptidase [Planctomycetota bacterium]|jgi:Zn-dependent membrane protease YugP|nr:zinc metallopeptidase [Planctomycetota bacterium]